jgi:hypothetical protein
MDLKMRLNAEMRQEMLERMRAVLFQPQYDALRARMTAHADACYQALFTKKEHELLATCPPEWFHQQTEFTVVRYVAKRDKVPNRWPFSKAVRSPYLGDPLNQDRLNKDTAIGKKLRTERSNIVSEWETTEVREEEFMRQARAQMNALKTVGQALQVWPALKELMGEAYFNRVAPSLPAIILSPQNALLEKALAKKAA